MDKVSEKDKNNEKAKVQNKMMKMGRIKEIAQEKVRTESLDRIMGKIINLG